MIVKLVTNNKTLSGPLSGRVMPEVQHDTALSQAAGPV
jgi:hypothetical protein